MPILVPIFVISLGSVRDATQAGGKLTNVPEKNPYMTANATNPCHVEALSQLKRRIPEATTVGINTLSGPVASARKLGNIRPKTEAAYVLVISE
jgi:hypothetical protein